MGTLSTCPRGMDTHSLRAPPVGQSLPTERGGKEVGSNQRREISNLAKLPVLLMRKFYKEVLGKFSHLFFIYLTSAHYAQNLNSSLDK